MSRMHAARSSAARMGTTAAGDAGEAACLGGCAVSGWPSRIRCERVVVRAAVMLSAVVAVALCSLLGTQAHCVGCHRAAVHFAFGLASSRTRVGSLACD